MRIRRRHPISLKVVRSLRDALAPVLTDSQLDLVLPGQLERAAADKYDIIFSEKEPVLFIPDGDIFPALRGFLRIEVNRRYLKVDSGAVAFVVNGADIMSPGVVDFDPATRRGELCVVIEERHNKPLCIARLIVDALEIDRSKKGKIAKNLHHIGDSLWRASIA